MSNVTDLVLTCWSGERETPLNTNLTTIGDDPLYFRSVTEHAGGDKRMQTQVFTAAINYCNEAEVLRRIEQAPWKQHASVVLLMRREEDLRPAVYGFAGARGMPFKEGLGVDAPPKLVCLIEAVPW